jgi:hypothetical protein
MRLPSLALAFALLALPAAAQDHAVWERNAQDGVDFADLTVAKNGRFTVFCRMTKTGPLAGLALSIPYFQTMIRSGESYGLTMIVNGGRDSVHMEARDIELWFEAKDLNQQMQLSRLFEDLTRTDRLDFAISAIGWRDSLFVDNSAELKGLMDDCL